MRGRPGCLLQSTGGEANRILLAYALSSMRIICPNKVRQCDWIIAVSLGCFVSFLMVFMVTLGGIQKYWCLIVINAGPVIKSRTTFARLRLYMGQAGPHLGWSLVGRHDLRTGWPMQVGRVLARCELRPGQHTECPDIVVWNKTGAIQRRASKANHIPCTSPHHLRNSHIHRLVIILVTIRQSL